MKNYQGRSSLGHETQSIQDPRQLTGFDHRTDRKITVTTLSIMEKCDGEYLVLSVRYSELRRLQCPDQVSWMRTQHLHHHALFVLVDQDSKGQRVMEEY